MRQRPSVTRVLAALALSAATAVTALAAAPASAQPPAALPGDVRAAQPRSVAADDARAYMVQLDGPPAAAAATTARRRGASATQSATQSRQQRTTNAADQSRIMRTASDRGLVARELYRVTTAYNGVAVQADPRDVRRLRRLPGVRSVVPLPRHERANAMSVPAVGAPQRWSAPDSLTGQGVRVGVIDSGIDYVHRTFGGSGEPADLDYARSSAANPIATDTHAPGFAVPRPGGGQLFPSSRVTGGFDFAGDAYDANRSGSATPRPDPNPMDCPFTAGGGHGTHVAGTVAGDGVASTGEPLPWSTAWPPSSTPLVGTGVAPQAALYALRVFGCDGSSQLVPLAIEWALDPDGDGDTTDRLDVLNLSLGSPFGAQDDPSAIAVQNAAAAGVVVVVSAGNDGDQTYQVGSPGVAPGVITVANMVSGSWRDAIEVTDSVAADGFHDATYAADFDWHAMTTPVAGALYRPATNRDGCGTFSSGEAASIAGKVVLLDWPSGVTSPCGSATRVSHAGAAGAVGVVIATDAAAIDLSIAGNAATPAAYVAGETTTELLAAAASGGGGATIRMGRTGVAHRYDTSLAGTVNGSSSRGPAGGGGLKPDLAAPGTDIRSAQSGTGTQAVSLSGTSMSAPHVAGAMAILRQKRPTWTAEELKAAVLNTADPDLHLDAQPGAATHTPARIGTGTLDVAAAVETEVVAMADTADGAVSVSFGALRVPVGAPFQAERTVELVNRGSAAVTYAVAFDERNAVPGVAWDLPDGPTATVDAGATATFRLRLRIDDPSQLRNVRDATVAATQASYRRRWLAEATGLVRLTAAGRPTLSVAAHASVRPAASTTAAQSAVSLAPDATSGTIDLTGSGFSTGDTVTDFQARRTVLVHQATSPARTVAAGDPAYRRADVRHVGVGAADGLITFGVTTWGRSPAPEGFAAVEIEIDSNRNGSPDYYVYPTRLTDTDVFVTCVWRVAVNAQGGCFHAPTSAEVAAPEGGTFDSDAVTMSVARTALGLVSVGGRFDYRVRTWDAGTGEPVDDVGPLTWSPDSPGIGFATDEPVRDEPAAVPFTYDADAARRDGVLGALILHHLGPEGQTAEVVPVSGDAPSVEEPPIVVPPVVVPPTDEPPGVAPPVVASPFPTPLPFVPPAGRPTPPVQPRASATAKRCRVPRVTGRSLSAARKRLHKAHCRVGKVTRPRARVVRGKKVKLRPLVVRRQSLKPGVRRKAGTKVALRLRERPRR